jgi:fucose 4-O-acetylase-like acetyltransferase
VGIVAVVAIHSLRPFFSPEISRGELWLGAVLQFAVPGFFVASGVLAATAQPVPPARTRSRLRRLLVPYAIASIAAQLYRASVGGESLSAPSVLLDFLLGGSFGPYYYVFHAVLFVLLTPWLARATPRQLAVLTAAALVAQWTAWLVPTFRFLAIRDPLHWLAFYLAGWWLRRHEAQVQAWIAERRARVTAAAAAGAALLPLHALFAVTPWLAGPLQWLHVACVLTLLFVAGMGRETRSRAVRFLSDASYTIYLFHLFFVLPASRLWAPASHTFDALAIGAAFASGLAGSLALVAAGRRLLGPRSRVVLGS